MSKVLVSGAGGFIGSHLVQKLLKEGHDVKAMVHYNSSGSNGWLDTFKHEAEIIRGDVRDQSFIRRACGGVDTIFHLAALIGIPYSYQSPGSYIETNVRGTLNILEAAKDYEIRCMVTSTSETYGSAQFVPMTEQHPANAQSPYAASKVAADALALSYYKSFNTPVTIVRPFNTYGPRQSTRAFIPQIITQLLSGATELKLGSLTPTRDLVFVEDTADAMYKIMQKKETIGETINISTGYDHTIGDIANKLTQRISPSTIIKQDKERMRPRKSEVTRLLGDNTKLKQRIIFNPRDLETGLIETIEWFKENHHLYKEGYAV